MYLAAHRGTSECQVVGQCVATCPAGRLEDNTTEWYDWFMRYEVELKPRATKDLRRIPKEDAARVVDALDELQDDLAGDVKRLTAFAPEYRLRVGDYRVLFDIEQSNRVVVYRVRHRRESYRA